MEKFNEELSCNIKPEDQTSQIIFCSGPNEWVMKINKDKGIVFNRESYPFSSADDFAKAVIDILEVSFAVKFERKNPPHENKERMKIRCKNCSQYCEATKSIHVCDECFPLCVSDEKIVAKPK